MQILYMNQTSSDLALLYSPELKLNESLASAGYSHPAVSFNPNYPQETCRYFYLLDSKISDYVEYRDHYWKEFLYTILGGRERLESSLLSMAALAEICTITEAAKRWKIPPSVIEDSCHQGKFFQNEARQSGEIWLISGAGMRRVFGEGSAQSSCL